LATFIAGALITVRTDVSSNPVCLTIWLLWYKVDVDLAIQGVQPVDLQCVVGMLGHLALVVIAWGFWNVEALSIGIIVGGLTGNLNGEDGKGDCSESTQDAQHVDVYYVCNGVVQKREEKLGEIDCGVKGYKMNCAT
jgi:prepilin signal peptidase PulO-like enzyme (type II secretory pathway)